LSPPTASLGDRRLDELHADLCKVFTNPVRIQILRLLRDGERNVSALVRASGESQPNISRHLAILRARGIVEARKDGVNTYYSLTSAKILRAFDLIREGLGESLERRAAQARRGRA